MGKLWTADCMTVPPTPWSAGANAAEEWGSPDLQWLHVAGPHRQTLVSVHSLVRCLGSPPTQLLREMGFDHPPPYR